MPLQMLAVQSRADCANNVLGASTWCAQTIIMGGTSATEIPMTQRPATVIAAIALKYALHEAHLSESEIGFFWMQRRQDTRRRPRKLPRQNQPNANPRTIKIARASCRERVCQYV